MTKFISSTIAAALLATVSVGGVAHAQSANSQNEIVVTGKFQKLWDKGSKLEAKGLDNLAKAQKDLTNASRDVLNAQSKRDTAQGKVANASAEFRQLTSNIPYFAEPKDAAKWAKKVSDAANSWSKNNNRQDDGQGDLKKAMKKQASAQGAVDKAQTDIERGRAMKAEAQQRSMALGR
jgi:predicted  nucleic acid-binding Zn-ribbon protein